MTTEIVHIDTRVCVCVCWDSILSSIVFVFGMAV